MQATNSLLVLAIAASVLGTTDRALAQKESVRPGINKPFESPNIDKFKALFELEGRDAFDHRDQILEACQIKPGMSVADIGAGTGLFTRMFSKSVGPDGRVYAVDISDEFVDHIRKLAEEEKLANVTAVLCTPDDVNLPPASVDLAFVCDTYHHFEFPARTLASLHKALKPDGVLILIDFHRIEGKSSAWTLSHVRAGREVFVQEIVDAGFREVEEKPDLLDESYFIRFEKAAAAAN
jgi:predicted methyltransferase